MKLNKAGFEYFIANRMKTKNCEICATEAVLLFRIQVKAGKIWIFACKACCEKSKSLAHYKYGGTWNGKRH